MRLPPRSAPLALALTLCLGACAPVHDLLSMVKVTPVPAKLQPASPNALEDRLYARAVKAIEERDYGTALEALQLARDNRSDDPRVLTALGVVYDKLGRFDLSKRYYDLAEKADPGSRVVQIDRSYSLVLQQRRALSPSVAPTVLPRMATAAIPDAQAPTPAPMRPVLGAPAPKRPVSADALYAQAAQHIQRQEYGLALGILELARSIQADDARILTAMGVVYDRLGRFDLSSRFYDLADKVDPGSKMVATNRRYSRMLLEHGGVDGVVDLIDLADAPPSPSPRPTPVRTASKDTSAKRPAAGDRG